MTFYSSFKYASIFLYVFVFIKLFNWFVVVVFAPKDYDWCLLW